MSKKSTNKYLHGFDPEEQDRLRRQARFFEQTMYRNIDFSRCKHILEVGCGVGAQTEILLRRFPDLKITSIDFNDQQLLVARDYIKSLPGGRDRVTVEKMDAMNMSFDSDQFDGAFFAWVLEHIPDPARVLSETRRVCRQGSVVFLSEVTNSHFFLDPYSPNVWQYWTAFNDFQYDNGGDPFIGAKLGNLLASAGFKDIQVKLNTWHFDKRNPAQRREHIEEWCDMMMSAEDLLLDANYVTKDIAEAAIAEMNSVKSNPNGVFLASYMQARACL